jgi:hypothetical protein
MNDPRIRNDPCVNGTLETVKEIHAIRLKLQDEYDGLSAEEETMLHNERAVKFLARIGVAPHLVNMSEQGKLKSREMAAR